MPERSVEAGFGAKLDGSYYGLSAVERYSAVGTDGGATSVTDLGGSRAWEEIFATLPARDYGIDARERAFSAEFGVIPPELGFDGSVALPAERDEVFDPVSLPIIIEESKRSLMVGDLSGLSASLASAVVTPHRGGRLTLPVRASVAIVSAPPTRVITPGPFVGCPPDSEAFARAEIPVGDLVRLFLDVPIAGMAGDGDSLATDPDPMDLLPLGITREAAEWMSREGYVVGTSADWCSALSAM